MGSGFSSFLLICSSATSAAVAPPPEAGLGELPESVVGYILVYLNPLEICRLAAFNRALRGATAADFVWESKLPKNYDSIISRVFDDDEEFSLNLGKKDIYAMLSRPNSIDGDTKKSQIEGHGFEFWKQPLVSNCKKVWLDKSTGRACVSISSNGLAITGMDDRRYWSRISTDESRFGSVAYLHQIWWFEVNGEVDFPFPAGNYSLYFRLQLGRSGKRFGCRICNSGDIHGWDKKPVKFQLLTSDGQQAISQRYLTDPGKWNHYCAGDFSVGESRVPTKIKFSMTQIDCTHTKGGLCVDSILVCPKRNKDFGK